MLTLKSTLRYLVPATLLLATAVASAKPYCGELDNALGPFDYRDAPPDALYLVEMAHYTDEVAAGVKGNTGAIGGDLDYTLRVFPNHVKALTTMAAVAMRTKVTQLFNARYPVECYFERAVRFQPDDGMAWGAYGKYLYSMGQAERAMPMLKKAYDMAPDNPSVNYNLGIAYFRAKQYDLAVKHAKVAYQHDFPLDGLRNMLVGARKWDGKVEPLPGKEDKAETGNDAAAKVAPKTGDDAAAKAASETAAQ
ncbi:tetratricopeptide repeat protein [Pseudoduganella sp. SL102]|uniref:tetratricopeptide repeat protein n=1 Tax=Pseudoduganella sp. SL102 TaxID=2995154 RepID=UPI00248ABB9A|nr:tetratricopeptide repeat protein [Pseudoduganella sp. SL102]WBS03219.1 tetratricopeptide repeat protein [Pseudoduganella sp. SL102]